MKGIFKKESKISKIGGKMEDDYLRFRNIVVFLNENIVPLYIRLGFNKEEQTDMVIKAIMVGKNGAKTLFVEYWTTKIKEGQIPLEKILPALTIKKLAKLENNQDERTAKINREIHRNLSFRFKEIESDFMKDYRPLAFSFDKRPLIYFGKSLELTDTGLNINVDMFIDLYASYMKACESEAKKQHQAAAEAINRFFNGAVEITDKELMRYFVLEDGVIKPNLSSINIEGYMRLGYRLQGK